MDIKIKSVDEKNNMIVENIPTIKNSSVLAHIYLALLPLTRKWQ